MGITQILELVDQGGQRSKSLQLGCKLLKLHQVRIGFVEVGGKGLLFCLGLCYSVAQLVEAIYDILQYVWDVQFKV